MHPPGVWSTTSEETEAPVGFDEIERYAAVRARPAALLAARVGLWTAVAVGFVGGVAGLAGRTAPEPLPPAQDAPVPVVPAAVAGTAERAATAWLAATEDDSAGLEDLFIDPPPIERAADQRLAVGRVVVVSGSELGPGYWSLTLAAEVVEPPVDDSGEGAASPGGDQEAPANAAAPRGADAEEGAPSRGATTWYLELGVVGDPEQSLAAVTAPAVLPAGPPVPDGWEIESSVTRLEDEDPVALTIDGFLRAMLAGGGDPGRYLAPGFDMPAPASPVFAELEIDTVEATSVDQTTTRAHVWATGTTAAGIPHSVRYQITLVLREDRWEVSGLSGAPAVEHAADGAS